MARNEEKHAGRLNRLWLQQLDEERLKKNPLRPGLGSLRTAGEVKKWIPSIKNDIDFYLKQSQVGCYPDRKISEFTSKIEGLTKEYKAYLRKYRELEGRSEEVPWTDKPYARKHKLNQDTSKDSKEINEDIDEIPIKKFVPLSVPILADEDSYKDLYGYDTMSNATVALNATETLDSPFNNRQIMGTDTLRPHRSRQLLGHNGTLALNATETLDSPINNGSETLRPHRYGQIVETDQHTLETPYSGIVETTSNAFNDKPLEFNKMKTAGNRFLKGIKDGGISSERCNELEVNHFCKCAQTVTMVPKSTLCEYCENVPKDLADDKQTHIAAEDGNIASNHGNKNVLGLSYSDSSGDEEEG